MAYLKRPGGLLYYQISGPDNAPVIVFTHGAGMDHQMFAPQLEVFQENYRTLVWDMPGHGNSYPVKEKFTFEDTAGELIALLDETDAQQVVLVGQSLGGYISQVTAYSYPDRVLALAIIGSTPLHWQLNKMDSWLLRITSKMFVLFPAAMLWKAFAHQTAVKPEVREYAKNSLTRVGKEQFTKIWNGVVEGTIRGIPSAPAVPLLITHGDKDVTGNIRKDAPGWHKSIPDSDYVVIPDAGHNANQDNPKRFNEELLSFLRKLKKCLSH